MGKGDYQPNNKGLRKIAGQLEKYYPRIVDALGSQVLPAAQYEQEAQKVIAPQQAALDAQIYAENAPKYAEASSAADLAAIQGSGGASVRAADVLNREIDPEYYATREATSKKLQDLFSGIDPNRLTGAETENVSRGLARYGAKTGSLGVPTAGSAVKAALMYGDALNRKRGTVLNAINTGGAVAPTFRTADAFGQATGRPGTSAFASGFGINPASVSNAQAQGTGAVGLAGNLEQLRQQINSQRRHYTDFVNQSFSASGISGLYGGCYILREALGKLPDKVEKVLKWLFKNKELSRAYHKLAAKVVPEMRRNPAFKQWVTENFAKPLIKELVYA